MTAKRTEEGWFWEWRAFGMIPSEILGAVRSREVRGTPELESDDEYFVSSSTDQNVKLRAGTLKLKPLLARLDDGCELYEESERLVFALPVTHDEANRAASLLGLSIGFADGTSLDAGALAAALLAGPSVARVRILKRRTQYAVGAGWVEVAELESGGVATTSLGVQSTSLAETRRIVAELDPARSLAPMGYVEACRRLFPSR